MAPVREDQLKQNFARNLRYLREGRKPYLSQQMLAKKLEVTQKSISRYENGISLPPAHVLVAIAELFGLTTDALFMAELPENMDKKEGNTTNENITYGNPAQDCRAEKQTDG
ncbi:MAG: helix-turn-helix domain-containing protein [Lachnospiraceae bacterium]|jgi:DNA-binding XRE family transcriptional regulator